MGSSSPSKSPGNSKADKLMQSGSMKSGSMKKMGRVKMLDRPGSCIPPADIFAGARRCRFEAFASVHSHLAVISGGDLASLLDRYPVNDSTPVIEALQEEYKSLVNSLERQNTRSIVPDTEANRESSCGPKESRPSLLLGAPVRTNPPADESSTMEAKVSRMELEVSMMLEQVASVKAQSDLLPGIHDVLKSRIASGSSNIATNAP